MLGVALGAIFKKPATTKYPAVKFLVPEGFRGEIIFHPEKCVGCKLCMRDCPAGAITIKEVGQKKFQAQIDLGKCIFCGQCVDSCLKKALEVTKEFELSQLENNKLKKTFHAQPEKNSPEQTPQG